MPYLTEEFFQRLPRSEADGPSVCVSPYPQPEEVSKLIIWKQIILLNNSTVQILYFVAVNSY